jgi:hypothetical protein
VLIAALIIIEFYRKITFPCYPVIHNKQISITEYSTFSFVKGKKLSSWGVAAAGLTTGTGMRLGLGSA